MNLLTIFIILSFINVVLSTIKSITLVSCNKWVASAMSGIYFAFYNIMVIYTVADFPMWQKCLITCLCNVIGVLAVMFVQEKMRKDKLWKIDATFNNDVCDIVHCELTTKMIPHTYIENLGRHCVFNIYCATQEETLTANKIISEYGGKAFASENKLI